MNGEKVMLFIGGQPVAEVKPIEMPLERVSDNWNISTWNLLGSDIKEMKSDGTMFEYYKRTGNVLYFRIHAGRLRIEISKETLSEFLELKIKYGTVVKITWRDSE